jgi:hypothetical protein
LITEGSEILVRHDRSQGWTKPALDAYCFSDAPLFIHRNWFMAAVFGRNRDSGPVSAILNFSNKLVNNYLQNWDKLYVAALACLGVL